MTPSKTILCVGSEGKCPICGLRARLGKTSLGWICASCAKRLLGSK